MTALYQATKNFFTTPGFIVEAQGGHRIILSKEVRDIETLFKNAYEQVKGSSEPTQNGHLNQFIELRIDDINGTFKLTKTPSLGAKIARAMVPVAAVVSGIVIHNALLANENTQPHYANFLERGSYVIGNGTDWVVRQLDLTVFKA